MTAPSEKKKKRQWLYPAAALHSRKSRVVDSRWEMCTNRPACLPAGPYCLSFVQQMKLIDYATTNSVKNITVSHKVFLHVVKEQLLQKSRLPPAEGEEVATHVGLLCGSVAHEGGCSAMHILACVPTWSNPPFVILIGVASNNQLSLVVLLDRLFYIR